MPTRTPPRPTPPPPARHRIATLRVHLAGVRARIRPLATRARDRLEADARWRAARRFWSNDVASVPWTGLLAAVGILLLCGWAADAVKGDPVFTYIPWAAAHPVATAGLLVALLVVAIWQVFLQRRRLISIGTLVQGPIGPHAALILPLSPAKADITPIDGGGVRVQLVRVVDGMRVPYGEVVPLDGVDLDAEIRELDELGRWSWQQLVRAIHPHRGALAHIVLIGSSGDGGSFEDLDRARTLLQPYLPPGAVIHPREGTTTAGVDFEDTRALLDTFHDAVRMLCAERDPRSGRAIRESDIVVDVTGGQKPTSVAGALATLSSAVTFQYVLAKPECQWEVLGYDMLHRGGGEI